MLKTKSSESFVLKVIDKFVKPFLSKDLNYSHVREILKLKLIMDNRRLPINAKVNAKKEGKEAKRSMLVMCITYFGVGSFIATLQLMKNTFGANILVFAMLMFMLFSVYISEFSAILLDTTEKSFYGALPIGHNEINTAKNIHIAYYVGIIAFSMMLLSVIAAVIFHGALYGVIFALICIALTIFCLHLAGILYYLLLKIFSGEKLKDILSGFQVFVTIALVLVYQIVPRLINFAEFAKTDMVFSPFMFIIPSAWFSAIFNVFLGTAAWYHYALSGVAVLVLILLEIVYNKKVMPEFEGELDKLTETAKENKSLSAFSRLMCKILSKDKQENAFMELVLIQVSRNRDIKLKIYPQLANVLILPLVVLLSQFSAKNGGIEGVMTALKESRWVLVLFYSVGLTSSAIYTLIGQSDNKESILFYQILPIENLSKCIRAGIKVVLFRYLTPIFAIFSIMYIGVRGAGSLPDVIIAYIAFIFITSLMIRLNAWVLPFSTETVTGNAGYNMLMFFMNMIILGGFAAAHIFLLKTLPSQLMGIAALIVFNIMLWKLLMNKKYVIARA